MLGTKLLTLTKIPQNMLRIIVIESIHSMYSIETLPNVKCVHDEHESEYIIGNTYDL